MADTTKAAKAAEGAAALKVHHLRPAPGARSTKIRVGRGEGGSAARPPVAVPRAPRPGTRCRRASRVAPPRCTCGSRSFAASRTRSGPSTRS